MFDHSLKNGDDYLARNFFYKYYMALVERLVETKDFNALFGNKPFFDQPVKNRQDTHKKLLGMSRIKDVTTRNLLDYLYHQNYYKLIDIDLSRQTNTTIRHQISLTGKLGEDDTATMLIIVEKQQNINLKFCLDSLIVTE